MNWSIGTERACYSYLTCIENMMELHEKVLYALELLIVLCIGFRAAKDCLGLGGNVNKLQTQGDANNYQSTSGIQISTNVYLSTFALQHCCLPRSAVEQQ